MTIGLIVDHHGSDHLLNDWFKHVSLTTKISVNIQFRSGFWIQHCLSINLSATKDFKRLSEIKRFTRQALHKQSFSLQRYSIKALTIAQLTNYSKH